MPFHNWWNNSLLMKLTRYQFDWCEMYVLSSSRYLRHIYILYVLIWKQSLAHLHIWLKRWLLKYVDWNEKEIKSTWSDSNLKIVWVQYIIAFNSVCVLQKWGHAKHRYHQQKNVQQASKHCTKWRLHCTVFLLSFTS